MHRNIFSPIIVLALLLCSHMMGHAQEFNAEVTVSVPKLQTADPAVFKTLEKDLKEFLNSERWTKDEYKPYERINANFSVNITAELGANLFSADIALKAIRPVYGSEYKTVLINHVDRDIIFNYQEFQPFENGTEYFKDNLSAVFSYYTQLILGLDAESFAPNGGDEYFRIAQNIINQIPSVVSETDKGWQSLTRKTTRYWISENMMSPRYASFRQAWYNYHRKSLDMMYADPQQALVTMVEALKEIEKTNVAYPNSIGVLMFLTAKSDEIVEIMRNASRTQKTTVYDIMRKLDPANTVKYNALRS
ncbi:MAG TPA: DUF4835 family protein [Saprospiraceae bacterium]|jgi:uncharacterized protein DUF4835